MRVYPKGKFLSKWQSLSPNNELHKFSPHCMARNTRLIFNMLRNSSLDYLIGEKIAYKTRTTEGIVMITLLLGRDTSEDWFV
jgi:hypothetical protein